MKSHNLETSSLKQLDQFSPDLMLGLLSMGYMYYLCSDGYASFNKMSAMPIYGKKTPKNLLLQNQGSFKAESWYIASGTLGLPSLIK